MSLMQTIESARIQAMKEKNTAALSTLRVLLSALKNKQIDAAEPLTDEEVQKVVAMQVKQLKDANSEFEKGGRDDLIEANNAEIQILNQFLPEQLSEEELKTIISGVVAAAGENPQFGQLMGAAMKEVAGRAEGNTVRTVLQSML